jgi:16S rRNA (uracil1498-N3)-methyltransferase
MGELSGEARHYVDDVLRLRPGARVMLFDGLGRRASAVLREGGAVEIAQVEAAPATGGPAVTLVCALLKADKMDFLVEKASEAGAHALWPIVARRSVVRLDMERGASRVERWRRIALAAARQCGRDHALEVEAVRPLAEALAALRASHRRILCTGEPPLSGTLPPRLESVALCTGPEGGFDDDEVMASEAAGFTRAGLGELTLRAETAPLVGLAAVLARAGVI